MVLTFIFRTESATCKEMDPPGGLTTFRQQGVFWVFLCGEVRKMAFGNLKDQDTSVTWSRPGLPGTLHCMSNKGTGSRKGSDVATSAEKPKSAVATLVESFEDLVESQRK